jgi:small GTP-binding protein
MWARPPSSSGSWPGTFPRTRRWCADQPTVGIDFVSKKMELNGKKVRLQLWDTAGQERFRSLIPSYVKDSNIAIVVFDCAARDSFDELKRWLDFVREYAEAVPIIVVGNKVDLKDERVVTEQDLKGLAELEKVKTAWVSAMTGEGVDDLFTSLSREALGLTVEKVEEGAQLTGEAKTVRPQGCC